MSSEVFQIVLELDLPRLVAIQTALMERMAMLIERRQKYQKIGLDTTWEQDQIFKMDLAISDLRREWARAKTGRNGDS